MVDPTYLYKVSSLCEKYVYIGITKNPQQRFQEHKNYSSNTQLRQLMLQYGSNYFKFNILTSGLRQEIEELEALAILEAKTLKRLYCLNVLVGSVSTGESSQIGEAHWNAKLSKKDIEEIRHFYSLGGITQKEIGEVYGVSNKVISKITLGIRWAEASGPISTNLVANRVANRRKLTDEDVIDLRKEALSIILDGGKLSTLSFATKYGVDKNQIRSILIGKSYGNLPGCRFKCINRVWVINEES